MQKKLIGLQPLAMIIGVMRLNHEVENYRAFQNQYRSKSWSMSSTKMTFELKCDLGSTVAKKFRFLFTLAQDTLEDSRRQGSICYIKISVAALTRINTQISTWYTCRELKNVQNDSSKFLLDRHGRTLLPCRAKFNIVRSRLSTIKEEV